MTNLDNPVWSSLTTLHRELALEHAGVLRYPADIAPFLAIETAGSIAPETLDTSSETPRRSCSDRSPGVGDDRLDAMTGERMGMTGLREISAVCTHPSSVGRARAASARARE